VLAVAGGISATREKYRRYPIESDNEYFPHTNLPRSKREHGRGNVASLPAESVPDQPGWPEKSLKDAIPTMLRRF
jgi:hypothetical protein